jgi:carbon monoxide dehydrogenase subunit G
VKLEQSFEVRAPLERVWATLIDVERVAPCLPGAEITEAGDDGVYRGNFTVKLGPTTAAYRGELHMEELDDAAHRVVMRASGQDKRGQGSAKATIVSVMSAAGELTRVEVETDFTITGRLARFGRGGMIKDISNRLLKDFSDCLQQRIEGEPQAGGAPEPAREASAAAGSAPAGSRGATPPAAGPAGAGSTGATPPAVGSSGAGSAPTGSSGAGAAAAPAPVSPAPSPAAKPISGLSLAFGVLLDRVKRLLDRLQRLVKR